MGFGERIRTIRGNLSQAAFAKKLGIGITTLQNYESKGQIAKGDILKRIHDQFSANVNWLLTGVGEPFVNMAPEMPETADPAHLETAAPGPPSKTNYSFARSVSQLLDIYNSQDPVLIPTIEANLNAFQASVHQTLQIMRQSKEIEELKTENLQIRKQNEEIIERLKNLEDSQNRSNPAYARHASAS